MSEIESQYDDLQRVRDPYLDRARNAASITIPFLVPEDGFSGSESSKTPYQSFGAHAVRTLASKLLLALLPPNTPFFRFSVNKTKLEAEGVDVQQVGGEIDRALISLERSIMTEVEESKTRLALESAMQHLIVAGNSLLYVPRKGAVRWFRLTNYVIARDPAGKPTTVITREITDKRTLSPDIQLLLENVRQVEPQKNKNDVNIFTRAALQTNGKWLIQQEIGGEIIAKLSHEVKPEHNPFIPLRFNSLDSEDYGRGLVEEYFGTINTIESLARLLNEGAIAMATTKIVIDKASSIRPSVLARTGNLGIISGNVQGGIAQDVGIIELQKQRDFSFVAQYLDTLKREISDAFLVYQARQAERVTAEEVRQVAQELEAVLGGVYSILANEFQLPLLKLLMERMTKAGDLPAEFASLPRDLITPMITAGLDALGRNSDFNKLIQLQQVMTPQEAQYLNAEELLKRKLAYLGIPNEGLTKSQQQQQAEQQAAQQQQQQEQIMRLAEKAAPAATKGLVEGPKQ